MPLPSGVATESPGAGVDGWPRISRALPNAISELAMRPATMTRRENLPRSNAEAATGENDRQAEDGTLAPHIGDKLQGKSALAL